MQFHVNRISKRLLAVTLLTAAANLVQAEADGARNIYRIDPAGLGQMRAWLDRQWTEVLSAFKSEAEKGERK